MQQRFPTHPVPYYRGPAEAAFGIEPVAITGNTAVSAMRLGPWARSADGATVHQGATGVLIDDTTAYAGLTARGPEQWAVSSEISVDFHSCIPAETEWLTCAATVDHRSDGWGHSSGQVLTANGTLISTVRQRMRYFPGDDTPHRQSHEPEDALSWLDSLDSRVELLSREGNRSRHQLKSDPGMRNPLGTLHGGISLAFSELLARKAWENSTDRPEESFRTSSIRMSYLRPGALDGNYTATVDIIHFSRSVVIAEILLYNTNDEAITFGVSTLHRVSSL